MEINITHLVNAGNMMDYSASIAEIGDYAGVYTWRAAMDEFCPDDEDSKALVTGDDVQTVKDYFGRFGAWDTEERESWTDQEVNALLLQFIAGDIREAGDDLTDDYPSYQKRAEAGSISSNIYKSGDQFFYCIGF